MRNFTRFFIFSVVFFLLGNIKAQSPESMNYQAVIRNASGSLVASQNVGLRIKIKQASTSGTVVYQETFAPTTNAYGSIAIQIGTGTVVSGTFATIDWGANSHYVETAVDIAGGTNYTVISTTQLMSVPYALYAKTSGNAIWQQDSISDINFGQGNVRIWETTEGLRLSVTGGTPLILKRNKSIANFGVPINFNLLNSSNEDTRYGQVVSSIRDNTAGAEFGSLSFLVADGSGSWSNSYSEERLRIETERVTVKNVMNLEPLNAAPSSPLEGDLYYDNAANQVKVYDDSSWVNLAGSSSPWSSNTNTIFTNKKVSVGHTNETYPLSVKSVHDGSISRGIDVLRTDNSGTNIGVPMSFSMLNSNNQPFEFAKLVGRTQINTSGAEIGSLSFQVADGTNWGQNYEQERMRIDNEMITVNAKNTASSDAIIRLKGTNANGSYSQLVDLKSTLDGHITSSKFVISTRNQGTMNDNFVVNSSGNVGVGTSSPSSLLHLKDNSDISLKLESDADDNGENDNPEIHLSQDGGQMNLKIGMEGVAGTAYSNSTGNASYIHSLNSSLQFAVSNSSIMTLVNGNVGIGTTSPSTLLQVSDPNADGPTFKIDGLSPSVLLQDNSGVSNTVDNFEIRNNLGNLQINYGDNADANDDGFLSNNAFTISNTGKVGIGTTDPKERLQLGTKMFFHAGGVVSAVMHNQFWNGSTWEYASDGHATGIEFNNGAIGQVAIWTAISGTAGSQLSPQPRLLITNDGKIGLGTTTPAYKLDVNGDINLTGSLRINGVAQTFGSGSSSTNATTFNYLSDGF
jgi:hypothetical protein